MVTRTALGRPGDFHLRVLCAPDTALEGASQKEGAQGLTPEVLNPDSLLLYLVCDIVLPGHDPQPPPCRVWGII